MATKLRWPNAGWVIEKFYDSKLAPDASQPISISLYSTERRARVALALRQGHKYDTDLYRVRRWRRA